jgi:formate/nitrite transporter FocA (FNT family)
MEEPAEKIEELREGEVERRVRPPVQVVHEVIRQEGAFELGRPSSALAWSGLAAGLSMGFCLVAEGLLKSYLPDTSWAPLISKLGYSLGFIIVILGRQQLFTENTILAIIPLLTKPSLETLRNVVRLWVIVLVTNLLGVLLFVTVVGHTEIFSPEAKKAFLDIGYASMSHDFLTVLLKGIFGGFLIALIIWLLPMVETAEILIIIILTYTIRVGDLTHIIAGSAEALYPVVTGHLTFADCFLFYMIPTLIGNIIGGVSLAAAINHAQVVAGKS